MKNWSLRQIYLYLVSFVSLMILLAGLISLVRGAADLAFPREYYEPGPADVYLRYREMQGQNKEPIPEEVIKQQLEHEKLQARRNAVSASLSGLKQGLSYVLVGLPTWLYHWRKIQSELAKPEESRQHP
ncbi:MAG TPA: hypothetical protein GXX30_03240 [Firmicutes bacterium]|nr:hypothetical protein [Candidatus Fermentithermobacillaceae bacterium]